MQGREIIRIVSIVFRQWRLTLLAGFLAVALRGIVQAGQGCCSTHGGVAGCDQETNKLRCADGALSPSCSCDQSGGASSGVTSPSKKHAELGKDILVGYPATARLGNLHPKMKDAFDSIRDVWGDYQASKPVITSGNDRKHSGSNRVGTRCGDTDTEAQCRATSDSLHYKDRAIDLRSHDMNSQTKKAIISDLQHKLGSDYKVGLHSKGTTNEHIHVEYHGN